MNGKNPIDLDRSNIKVTVAINNFAFWTITYFNSVCHSFITLGQLVLPVDFDVIETRVTVTA